MSKSKKVVEQISITELNPYANNARTHSKKQLKKLVTSIQTFGFNNPIIVDEDNMVLAGHGRLIAAEMAGLDQVPVVRQTHLTADEKKAYIIADNRIADEGGWDNELLSMELANLKDFDFDISSVGFDDKELNKFLYEDNLPANPIAEPVNMDEEKLQTIENPKSKIGDVWILGDHILMCGDSTDPDQVSILCADGKADMLFTDPPYGMSYQSGRQAAPNKKGQKVKDFGMIKGDDLRDDALETMITKSTAAALQNMREDSSIYVCFPWRTYGNFLNALIATGIKIDGCIVWRKNCIGLGNSHYRPQHEFIFYTARGRWFGNNAQSDVWEIGREPTSNYVHPTQKPLPLIEKAIINSSQKGEVVLDLFGGSGSTLMAAERRGRKARLMELDPKYVDTIINRWQIFTKEEAIHAETGLPYKEYKGI